jgi:hypothetical protein
VLGGGAFRSSLSAPSTSAELLEVALAEVLLGGPQRDDTAFGLLP